MTKKKAPAKAEQSFTLKSPRTTRLREGGRQTTALIYKGDLPEKGQVLKFTLENGVTYQGKVKDFAETGGEVLAEFSDGPAPVAPK